ncbi:MAG: hypothetical protein N2035_09205 [Chthoniobacterales bacterium]|nr:hypothetical protein [Chthoniobacterales bacterium]
MKRLFTLIFVIFGLCGGVLVQGVEVLSAVRGEVLLNGLWSFDPQNGQEVVDLQVPSSWNANPKVRAAWVGAMRRENWRYWNYPAILLWETTRNVNNHPVDQDPRFFWGSVRSC